MTVQEPKHTMDNNMQRSEEVAPAERQADRRPYEKPAVIYSGVITTRAGSGGTGSVPDSIDPADIFGQ